MTVNEALSGLMDAADAAIAGREHEPVTTADVGAIFLAMQTWLAKHKKDIPRTPNQPDE